MLPLLLAGTKALTKKENPEPKKIKTNALLNKSKPSEPNSDDIKKSSAIILRPSSAISTRKISTKSFIPKKEESVLENKAAEKRIGFQDFIKELESINNTLNSIKSFLNNQISNKEKERTQKRITSEKLKKKQKESDLEKKKPKKEKGEFIKAPGISFLDAIINYLTNVFLGTLAVFALENLPKIIGAFEDISKNFNVWTALKFGILTLTTAFRRSLRRVLSFTGKILRGPASLIGRTIKFAASQVGSLLKTLGTKVVSIIKEPLKKLLGPGLSGALGGAARGVGSLVRRGPGRLLPRLGAAIAGRTGAQVGKSLGILTGKGLRHFARIGGILKRIPVVGALIAMGIDLALGVPPDEAVVGAIGGSIGAAIGGGIGSLILPLLGTAAGGFVGGIAGDWLAKQLWRGLKPMITSILPGQEDTEEPMLQAEGGSAGSRSSTRSSSSSSTAARSSGSGGGGSGGNSGGMRLTGHARARVGNDIEFLKLLRAYSARLRINPADLLGLMASESGINPASSNGTHVGLIQFSASSAASVGTSQSALRRMTRAQQMPYVYKYLKPKLSSISGKITPGHLYTAVFLPAFVSKPASYVVAKRGGFRDSWGYHPASWYTGNAGLDINKDGSITIAELGKRISDKRREFGIHGGTVVSPSDIGPDLGTDNIAERDVLAPVDMAAAEEPMDLYIADIRGAANQKLAAQAQIPGAQVTSSTSPLAPSAMSPAKPASSVAPSVSAEPSYQKPQSVVVPIPIQQPAQQTSSGARGGGTSFIPVETSLNIGDAYREVLNISLYKR